MKRFAFAVSVLSSVCALLLCSVSMPPVEACPQSNSCNLAGNNTEYFFGSPRRAEFSLYATWHTVSTPFLGVTSKYTSYKVTNVSYTPSWFYCASCESTGQGVEITVNCDMEGGCGDDHSLTTDLTIGPSPNNCYTAKTQDLVCN